MSLQIEEEIAHLEKTKHMTACSHVAARNRLEGETISKYWTQINKAKTPRDTIQILKYPDIYPPK